jgi:ribose transport system permease protein
MTMESTKKNLEDPFSSSSSASAAALDRGRLRRWNLSELFQRSGLLWVLIIIFVAFSILRPSVFATGSNLLAMVESDQVILVLAIGITLTLRLGDLDLSFGAIAASSAILVAQLTTTDHFPVAVAAIIAVLFGLVAGALNALLVVQLGLNSFIATLGTMSIYEGIGYGVSNSTVVTLSNTDLAKSMNNHLVGVPLSVWYGWIIVVLFWLLYEWTPFGRLLLFVGGNREAALLLGLPVKRLRITAYLVSGAMFSLGGVILVGAVGAADPSAGAQYLLPPLSAAFLGTAVLHLGRFNAIGVVIGSYVLAVLSTGLVLMGVASWVSYIIDGGALVLAIGLAMFASRASGSASSRAPGL